MRRRITDITNLRCAAIVAALLLCLALPAGASARSLSLGFMDGVYLSGDAGERALWLDRSRDVGANVVRIGAAWRGIATARPADERDPGDPAYNWGALDAALIDATARGLDPLVTIESAPDWAEGSGRRASARPGTWKPSPVATGRFATAIATRYSGSYAGLPRVRRWQLLNEPNLEIYLAPQWRRGRAFAPAHYRKMLTAATTAIRAVDRRNIVATAGTAPYGDQGTSGTRMRPLRFWRELLCFKNKRLQKRRGCGPRAYFQAYAHHPYAVRGPYAHSFSTEDAALPDVRRITRVVRAARRKGTARVPRRPRLWITEVSWDSRPPDPDGVPAARHARWLGQALEVLQRQGAELVVWFQVRDQERGPGYASTYQSGVFLRDGTPKLAARSYRLPLVAYGRRGGRVSVWTRAPAAGSLVIERRVGSRWKRVAGRRVAARASLRLRVKAGRGARLRARLGEDTSRSVRV